MNSTINPLMIPMLHTTILLKLSSYHLKRSDQVFLKKLNVNEINNPWITSALKKTLKENKNYIINF